MTELDFSAARNDLDALAAAAAVDSHAPSLAWAVVHDGALVLHGSVGGLDDGSEPTTATVYRIASMTKSFTAAAVLALRDDGVLSLDNPIATYAPELAAVTGPTTDSPPITLRHLLSMDSGLATDDAWADRHLDIGDDELTEMVADGAWFANTPGTRLEYSNLGFGLIGRVVARITGEPVQAHISRRLLAPLGLGRTTWTQPPHDDWARPYRADTGTDDVTVVSRDLEPLGDGGIAPMGGLWTCLDDLARWVTWMDAAFPARDGSDDGPLRRASRREQQQAHRARPVSRTAVVGDGLHGVPERVDGGGYGYGLYALQDLRFGHHVTHSGGLPGYGSNMRWLPGRRIGVIALANVTYAPIAALTRRMLEVLGDRRLVPARPARLDVVLDDACRRLVGLLNHWDDATADELFADNVALDLPFPERATAARSISDGGSLVVVRVRADSLASAVITTARADGASVSIDVQLSPHAAPRIEWYEANLVTAR